MVSPEEQDVGGEQVETPVYPPSFKERDRVRIRESYREQLIREQRRFAGCCGEVVRIDGHRIDVILDRSSGHAQQRIVSLFATDALEPAPPGTASWQPKSKPARKRRAGKAAPIGSKAKHPPV
jgi:hypothetical protein